ncbi:penicillin-binding transpeptidase domain-containing protein [Streptomyces uncialis]|uniref:penicillin-binding transpeptidase domain-containing protein n=1 Tax=Streptomyces uncialis TaxID=1048205 RepID=UPI00381322B8
MRGGAKAAVIGGMFAALVGGAAYSGYVFVDGLRGGHGPKVLAEPTRTGTPTASEVAAVAKAFFDGWQSGDTRAAARATNDAVGAEEMLVGYHDEAGISGVEITAGTPRDTRVAYQVRAVVTHSGKRARLAYESELHVVRGPASGRALVEWKPSVLHPELLDIGDVLVTGEASKPQVKAVDRDGETLTARTYPSLAPVLDQLREKYGDRTGGTPGIELAVRHASGAPDTPLLTLSKGRPGTLRTTLSARVQRAAERAVLRYPESSVVAVRPSTGEVLALANRRNDGFNAAFQGQLAPGSTMKIVTAATLIENGVVTADDPAPCPDEAVWQGQAFGNIAGLEPDLTATLLTSFQRSCNTAFVKLVDEKPLTDESLTQVARDRFGLGRDNWTTGIASFDGRVPPSTGPDRAAGAIGQGLVQMSPLNMASVTATAMTGTFRQPFLVPRSLDDRRFARAEGLSPDTVTQLRRMMEATARVGTAAGVMAGLGGDIGAKTGSAEVDGQSRSNSWFTGYRDDMAATAMTQGGGRGGDAAGPIVVEVLRGGPAGG